MKGKNSFMVNVEKCWEIKKFRGIVQRVERIMKTLDVGCGYRPAGDVNVDIHRTNNPETRYPPMDAKKISNFVLASGCCLPFRNGVFEEVYSDNSMEHVSNYVIFFKELLRVSSNAVIIRTPHRLSRMKKGRNHFHKQHFNARWFERTLRKLGYSDFNVTYSNFLYYPHSFLPLVRLPKELTVQVYKTKRNSILPVGEK